MRKIAIIQPTHLGDLLCSVPLYRALRRGWPEAEILLVGDDSTRPVFPRLREYIDRLLTVGGVADRWKPGQLEFLVASLRAEAPDLVIPLDFCPPASFWAGPCAAGGESAPSAVPVILEDDERLREHARELLVCLARRTGARCAAGLADRDIGRARLFAIPVSYWRPVPVMLLELARALGVPSDDISLEFPLTDADRAQAAKVLNDPRLAGPGPLIGLHPGAAFQLFRWPHDRFAAVGDLLAERCQARILITGTAQERPLAAAVAAAMRHGDQVVNASGQTSLGGFAALIDKMDLLISNDTGAVHVARARDRPTVVICGFPLEAAHWLDWGTPRPRCLVPPADRADHCIVDALLAIPADAVAAEAEKALAAWRP